MTAARRRGGGPPRLLHVEPRAPRGRRDRALPEVVQHDEIGGDDLLGHSHVVLSPGPGSPRRPRRLRGGPRGAARRRPAGARRVPRHAGPGHGVRRRGRSGRARARRGGAVSHDGRGVFAGLPQHFRSSATTRWPRSTLPECLEATAACAGRTRTRRGVMGVRHRDLPLEGVQFHPESILSEHGAALVANFLELS